jgi:hypothetical protein
MAEVAAMQQVSAPSFQAAASPSTPLVRLAALALRDRLLPASTAVGAVAAVARVVAVFFCLGQ